MTDQPSLFDSLVEPTPRPIGSLRRARHFAEQARQGRMAAMDALTLADAEVAAFLAQEERTAAAHDAAIREPSEGKTVREPRPTSAKAASCVAPKTGTQRAMVLADIVVHGGATDFELHHRLGMLESSVRPRRGELLEGDFIRDSGGVRQHQGSDWTVWEATTIGVAWHRRQPGGAT